MNSEVRREIKSQIEEFEYAANMLRGVATSIENVSVMMRQVLHTAPATLHRADWYVRDKKSVDNIEKMSTALRDMADQVNAMGEMYLGFSKPQPVKRIQVEYEEDPNPVIPWWEMIKKHK